MALALDVIGERWTWLILRGLLTGPKRFGDLLSQLPGIGTNLLSERLRQLIENQVVEKSGTQRQSPYRLTPLGEQLRPLAHDLIRWGRNFQSPSESFAGIPVQKSDEDHGIANTGPTRQTSMPEWDMLAIEAAFVPGRAKGIQSVIEVTLSGFTFHLVIRNSVCRAVTGPAIEPDATIVSDSATLLAINSRETSVQTAESKVRLKIEGDRAAANLLFELFE
jgi:DNA-binding HxlR family transcriptional regulator